MLIHPRDFGLFVRKGRQYGISQIVRRLLGLPQFRSRKLWENNESASLGWYSLPIIRDHFNNRITQTTEIPFRKFIAEKHVTKNSVAVSIACGTGNKEIEWVQTGVFSSLYGHDISESRIAEAERNASVAQLTGILEFEVRRFESLHIDPESMDVVIAEGALHHIKNVGDAVKSIRRWLKPGGLLIVVDYVGPSRFQWSNTQIDVVNLVLDSMDSRFKTLPYGNGQKHRIHRPGTLSMRINDPSEARESDQIVSQILANLELVERVEIGGALLHPLLSGISQNFSSEKPEHHEYLRSLIELETALMKTEVLPSDFDYILARKPALA